MTDNTKNEEARNAACRLLENLTKVHKERIHEIAVLEELLQQKQDHELKYFHKIKLQLNEAVLNNMKVCQVDLMAALSKARRINFQILLEIRKQKKRIDDICEEFDNVAQCLHEAVLMAEDNNNSISAFSNFLRDCKSA